MQIKITSDIHKVLAQLQRVQKEGIPVATQRALNRTAEQARTEASREISREWGFKVREAKDAIRLKRATRTHLVAVLEPTGNRKPLYKQATSAKQTKQGVIAKIGGKARLYKHAYLAKMPSGHTGIFRTKGGRRGPVKMGKTGKRYTSELPIVELRAPSIPTAFVAKRTQDLMQKAIKEKFPVNFEREMKFAMSKVR